MNVGFWATFLLPWLLDLVSGEGVQLSVFGALLWGSALGFSLLASNMRDPRFKKRSRDASYSLSLGWFLYWLASFFYPANGLAVQQPGLIKTFIYLHAGLLSSALGMMAVLFLTSLAWLVHEAILRKPSWERRGLRSLRLPSLESLDRGSTGALSLATRVWGMGLFLAAVTTYLSSKQGSPSDSASSWNWIQDPKVLFTAFLWLLLYLGNLFERLLSRHKRWQYRSYLILSFAFVGLFMILMSSKSSMLHEPVNWFLR